MFGLERLQTIRELVIEKKSVEVTHLSRELDVSEVTIRRDLDKLEKEGLVVKTYGGAILVEDMLQPMYSRVESKGLEGEDSFDSVTIDVATTASKLIVDGDTVFIDGSQLGHALLRQLQCLEKLIIVTNNIEIAIYIHGETEHKVIIIGGEVDSETGNVTEYDQLEELLIEKTFIGVDGIDLTVGYTVSEKNHLRLYKQLKSVTRELIVMVKSDVFNKRGLVRMVSIDGIETVVTDKHVPDEFKTYYYEHNIKVHSSMLTNI